MNKEEIKNYLDNCISRMKEKRDKAIIEKDDEKFIIAMCYIDAYQSVRISIFGGLKKG